MLRPPFLGQGESPDRGNPEREQKGQTVPDKAGRDNKPSGQPSDDCGYGPMLSQPDLQLQSRVQTGSPASRASGSDNGYGQPGPVCRLRLQPPAVLGQTCPGNNGKFASERGISRLSRNTKHRDARLRASEGNPAPVKRQALRVEPQSIRRLKKSRFQGYHTAFPSEE